jgi:hypothetical protein
MLGGNALLSAVFGAGDAALTVTLQQALDLFGGSLGSHPAITSGSRRRFRRRWSAVVGRLTKLSQDREHAGFCLCRISSSRRKVSR